LKVWLKLNTRIHLTENWKIKIIFIEYKLVLDTQHMRLPEFLLSNVWGERRFLLLLIEGKEFYLKVICIESKFFDCCWIVPLSGKLKWYIYIYMYISPNYLIYNKKKGLGGKLQSFFNKMALNNWRKIQYILGQTKWP
jgi:hypothetical protein